MRHGIDVVVLEAISAPAVDTLPAGEGGDWTEVQCGFQLGGEVPTEVLDPADLDAVMEHGFDEGILAEISRHLDRHRSPVDDVARLAIVGVATTICGEVADDHELGARAPRVGAAVGKGGQRVRGVGLEPLGDGAISGRFSTGPLRREVDAIDERHAHMGW